MPSPWLDIPLEDYEGHMALPDIGQAQMLADEFASLIGQFRPASAAIVGCAGGNGFDRVAGSGLTRLVGIDINPRYIEAAAHRFASHAPRPELHVGDIQSSTLLFEPVELIYAALIFEYVDLPRALRALARHCKPDGTLAALLQLPHESAPAVSPSQYASLRLLQPAMRLVSIPELHSEARAAGFARVESRTIASPAGKRFLMEVFHR